MNAAELLFLVMLAIAVCWAVIAYIAWRCRDSLGKTNEEPAMDACLDFNMYGGHKPKRLRVAGVPHKSARHEL
ncbi:MAG: hypothetical protein ACREC0_03455 [Methylocella sp.]